MIFHIYTSRAVAHQQMIEDIIMAIEKQEPFDDGGGKLEVIEGFPEGANIPFFPETPQEFAPGLDSELKRIATYSR